MHNYNKQLQQITAPIIKTLNKQSPDQDTLIIAASHLEMDILPQLYSHLNQLKFVETLNVLLYTRGGDINAARRVALLLHEYCNCLNIVAPYHCQSSGTLLALGASTIYYSPLSIFTAIDPHLHGNQGEQSAALSSADIKLFNEMSQDWFNTELADQNNMLAMLCDHIFPPTLTSFYRTVLEVKEIAKELLTLTGQHCQTTQAHIIDTLMFSFHSHDYAVTGKQLCELGLPCENNHELNQAVWPIVEYFNQSLGGGNRSDLEQAWCDTTIVSSTKVSSRWKDMKGLNPSWSVNTGCL